MNEPRPRPPLACRLLAVVAAVGLAAGACSPDPTSSSEKSPEKSPEKGSPPTVGAGRGTPQDPARNGSLDGIKVKLTQVATLDQPTQLQPRPGSDELWVTERKGTVRRVQRPPGSVYRVLDQPVIDVSSKVTTDGEMGLLGLAFSADGRQLFVDYNTRDRTTHLVRYTLSADGAADAGSVTELLAVDQPYPNHKGGDLHLGPDGFLYFGLGDGGSQNDPDQRAGNLTDLHGKLLRIDPSNPSGSKPYSIPADNPFANGGGRREIYLYGVRNPWRFSFDRSTKDLWIGDVGQNDIEEIDHLPASSGAGLGQDLGWSGVEGTRENIPERIRPDTVPPVFQYSHEDGRCSITGGVVYRGHAIPALVGTYLFSDYCASPLRGLKVGDGGKVIDERPLGVDLDQTISIDQDADGEVYLLSDAGPIMRLDGA